MPIGRNHCWTHRKRALEAIGAGCLSSELYGPPTGRASLAIELDPAYVYVVVNRWEQLTGETARLEGKGLTFAKVNQERIIT